MEINVDILKSLIQKLNNAKILVIGDLALDEMIYGDTERISREAPVLILQHTHTKYILGGASNAAHNVAKINDGKVSVIGIIGDDYQANDLKNAFDKAGIDCSSLVVDKASSSLSNAISLPVVSLDTISLLCPPPPKVPST